MSSRPSKKKSRNANEAKGRKDHVTFGYWLVAFVDLLGQQEAFLKTDYLPDERDPAQKEAFLTEVRASVGVIRQLRRLLDDFGSALVAKSGPSSPLRGLPPEALKKAEQILKRRISEHRSSDGVMLSCSLQPEEGHTVPILGVYDVLCTCAALMLVQLALGRPIRGGLDVGVAMVDEGELFGAALVKAYRLESKVAKYPRLAVGDALVKYLTTSTMAPGDEIEREFERQTARALLNMLARDEDGHWIIDYAGPQAIEFILGSLDPTDPPTFARGRAFAHASRDEFQKRGDDLSKQLFERYSKLARYLDARAHLWRDDGAKLTTITKRAGR